MEKKGEYFKVYYIFAIVYAIVGLIDSLVWIFTQKTGLDIPILKVMLPLFSLVIFAMSIAALVLFSTHKFAKITLVMPIYHLASAVFMIVIGVTFGIVSGINGAIVVPPGLAIWGIVSSLFELVFSLYVLLKFQKKSLSRQ